MLRNMAMLTGLVFIFASAAPVEAGGCKGCTKVAKAGDGYCCGKGEAFGVKLASQKLYDALKGKEVAEADIAKCPCAACKKASSGDGGCDRCLFTGGKKYSSPVAYRLAKGKPMPAELVTACPQRCDDCKTAHGKNGRCDKCGVGFVAGRMFENTDDYKAALASFKTIEKAAGAAKHCDRCAVAMVTDGKCDKCNVKFKDGQMASAGR